MRSVKGMRASQSDYFWPLAIMILMILGAVQPVAAGGCAPSSQSGTINTDTTWCASNSPYTITNDITVANGVTLTIEPGTTVLFHTPIAGNGDIWVNGTVLAQGTLANPILFTSGYGSPDPADWSTITFNPSSVGNILNHVTIEYGGYFDPAVEIKTDALTMTNSMIRHNGRDGIAVTDASPTISNTAFEDNGEAALALFGGSYPVLSGLSAAGNDLNGIIVHSDVIEQDYVWGDGGLNHYRLRSTQITIDSDVTLTITPGTRVGFRWLVAGNGRMVINGTLHAQGTPAQPILITSDGTTSDPGDWQSLIFNPSSTNNLLDYVTVEYGGSFEPAVEIHTSNVTIQNSTIARNNDDGIEVAAGTPTITQNNIFDNNGYGLRRIGNDTPVQARCNWWGNASGPTVTTNPDGIGQQVSSGVTYENWLVEPAPDGPCTGHVPRIYLPFITN